MELHVLPLEDIIEHEAREDCICGPECRPIKSDDDSMSYLYLHYPLDNREMSEEDFVRKIT